jgi:hypothetical protein
VAQGIKTAYQNTLEKLLTLDFAPGDEKAPQVLTLAPDAKAAWVAFVNEWGAEQHATEGALAAAYSKLEGYAARLGLLHHVVGCVARGEDDLKPITRVSIEAGTVLGRWFAQEARRVYNLLAETDRERDVRRLTEWIHAQGGTTTSKKLQRSNSRKFPTAEAATLALDALAAAGYGCWRDRRPDSRGGRPTRDFILHPTIDETDETSFEAEEDGDSEPPETSAANAETPDDISANPQKPRETRSLVGFDNGRTQERATDQPPGSPEQGPEVSSDAPGVSSATGTGGAAAGGAPPGELSIDPETGEGVLEL